MADLRNITDEELEERIAGTNGPAIHAAVAERQRRQHERSVARLAKPHPVVWWAFAVAVLSMIFAAVAAWPVIRSWFQKL